MSSLIGMRLRLEPGRIRQALLNPVGLSILAVSLLVPLVLLAALGADEWLDRAFWMPLVGLLGYAATVLAHLFVEDWPADPGLWQLLAIRNNIRSKLKQLRSDQTHIGRDALLPEVAEAARKLDRQIVPDYRRTVIRRDRLDAELRRYAEGVLPAPSAVLLKRLRRIATERQQALTGIIAHAANADAVLLQLLEVDDTAECVERAAFWQADLQDIQEALAEVLSGYDPFETAMGLLPPGELESRDLNAAVSFETHAFSHLRELEDRSPAGDTAALKESQEEAVEPSAVSPGQVAREPSRAYPGGLTRREVEVLALIADGRKSKEIADELVITVATVNRHVLNIYSKIDARGRADATRYALRHNIKRPINGSYDPGTAGAPAPRKPDRPPRWISAGDPVPDERTLELTVLLLLSEGRSQRLVAEELGISTGEVEAFVTSARSRLSGGRSKP